MDINKLKQTNKLKVTLLSDGSLANIKIFSYKKLNKFEPDSSNIITKK